MLELIKVHKNCANFHEKGKILPNFLKIDFGKYKSFERIFLRVFWFFSSFTLPPNIPFFSTQTLEKLRIIMVNWVATLSIYQKMNLTIFFFQNLFFELSYAFRKPLLNYFSLLQVSKKTHQLKVFKVMNHFTFSSHLHTISQDTFWSYAGRVVKFWVTPPTSL